MIPQRSDWERRNRHEAGVFWLTGLSGAGKSTLAERFYAELYTRGYQAVHLDGDSIRSGLCKDLSFTAEARTENIRRAGETAKLFFDQGTIAVCSFISPFQADRDTVRTLFPENSFHEIFVRCSLEQCIARDPKGLYQKNLPRFTGISSPYEEPIHAELVIDTEKNSIEESFALLWSCFAESVCSFKE